MTLTEFLTARIAEDERLVSEYPSLTPDFPPKWELGLYFEGSIAMALTVPADRVLAECEAKRRIIDLLTDAYGGTISHGATRVLSALAAVYAEHPNYDEAWRP